MSEPSDTPASRFGLWLLLVLVAHLVAVLWWLDPFRMRDAPMDAPTATSAQAQAAVEPLPPRQQEQFLDLLERESERLPALPPLAEASRAASPIVLPEEREPEPPLPNLEDELARIRAELEQQERAETERRRAEAAARARAEEERRRAEAAAVARAEEERRQRLAQQRREREATEAEAKARAEAAERARAEAAELARAEAAAKARAEAEARAAADRQRQAAAQAAAAQPAREVRPARPAGGGQSAQARADLDWYDRNVLYPALDQRWIQPRGPEFQGRGYQVSVRVTVTKDGTVTAKNIIASSGNAQVDASVREALNRLTRVDPLPSSFEGTSHTQTFRFVLE